MATIVQRQIVMILIEAPLMLLLTPARRVVQDFPY